MTLKCLLKIKIKQVLLCSEFCQVFRAHIVSGRGVHVDPKKVETVSNYLIPKDLKELNHFLGLTSYRRFIKGYGKIAIPLHKLRQKDNNCCWNDNCE